MNNMECKKCGKRIVLSEDWGDYDDACEWACTCMEYTEHSIHQMNREIVLSCPKCAAFYKAMHKHGTITEITEEEFNQSIGVTA
jgi:hypothetical protein